MQEILVLYYSHTGAVKQMAQLIARGVEKVPGMGARLRTAPKVSTVTEATEEEIPDSGAPYVELRDLEDGLNYLKSLPYVDGSRIGIHGWSYGGSMTSYAMTHSKSFKIGIAGGTETDWRLYDSIYTERYMMMPQNNREGYDRSSIVKSAKNLSGCLLLIHGQIDDNVHMQNLTQFVYELQRNDKQFEMMYYPTARHGVTNPAQVKHWYTMMTDFIVKNL